MIMITIAMATVMTMMMKIPSIPFIKQHEHFNNKPNVIPIPLGRLGPIVQIPATVKPTPAERNEVTSTLKMSSRYPHFCLPGGGKRRVEGSLRNSHFLFSFRQAGEARETSENELENSSFHPFPKFTFLSSHIR